MTTIGVLGLQGAVSEHVRSIVSSGAKAVVVKKVEELDALDGLILPGGESTTMRKLMDRSIWVYGTVERHGGKRKTDVWDMCRFDTISKRSDRAMNNHILDYLM